MSPKALMISEEKAIEQLRVLISPLLDLRELWNPFVSSIEGMDDDYYVLQWIRHKDNGWSNAQKENFQFFVKDLIHYKIGNYARAVLLVLGTQVK